MTKNRRKKNTKTGVMHQKSKGKKTIKLRYPSKQTKTCMTDSGTTVRRDGFVPVGRNMRDRSKENVWQAQSDLFPSFCLFDGLVGMLRFFFPLPVYYGLKSEQQHRRFVVLI